MRRLVISLVVLLLLFLGVDTVARFAAQKVAAGRATEALHLTSEPTVAVHGFPFLTQAARGRFDDITVTADTLTSTGTPVVVNAFSAELSEVSVPVDQLLNGTTPPVRVNGMTGAGTVTYDQLLEQVPLPQIPGLSNPTIGYSNGDVVLGATAFGQEVSIPMTISFDAGTVNVRVAPDAVSGLPPAVQKLVTGISGDLQLPTLPYDMQITSINPGQDGLSLTAALPHPITVTS